jgi:DNA-binding NarL/FixJ family response regulator
MADAVNILIVEDHQATLEGLSAGLAREPGFNVVGTSADSDEALKLVVELIPQVVLLDLHVPGERGPKSMIEEFCRVPGLKVVIFSAENRLAFVQAVLAMGVAAYLLKSERISKVAETISAVMSGKSGIVSDELQQGFRKLTPTEAEVLAMLGRGMKYQDIADSRYTTVATVRKQCETLQLKLGLDSREQLIAWAVKNGYGSVESGP